MCQSWFTFSLNITFILLILHWLRQGYLYISTNTRNKQTLGTRQEDWGKQAFSYYAANDWNSLPVELRNMRQIKTFKTKLKKHLST